MSALLVPLQPDADFIYEPQNTVVVTGFGPFKDHSVNASWEAVKLLPTIGIEQELGICLVTEQVPVSYAEVGTRIPQLWDVHKPLLVIHVGMSSLAKKVILEQVAQKTGYTRLDVEGCKPEANECCAGSCPMIRSKLHIEQLSKEINSTCEAVETGLSEDAGRYLCEYIYYTSLNIDCSRSLFIHVPPLDKPYSAEQLARGLADIVRCLVHQLRSGSAKEPVLITQ